MAFGCEVDDAVNIVFPHDVEHGIEVADVGFFKSVIGHVFDVFQILQIACIGQFVEVDNAIFRIFVDKQSDNMAADESGAAGDDYIAFEIHCWLESWFMHSMRDSCQCGILNPKVVRNFVLSSTE